MAYAPVFLRGQPDQDQAIVVDPRHLAAPVILFCLYDEAGGI